MPAISWLHLTDLHFGMKGQEWLWPNLKQEFYDDLSRIVESAGPWDAVLFSGDLTQKGSSEEFNKVSDVLNDLWRHLRSLGSDPVFICVPGNHDLERPASHDPIVKALRLWNKDKEIRDVFWNNKDNEYKLAIDRYFANYSKWFCELQLPKPSNLVTGYLPGDFSTVLTKGDFKVGLIGINTSFLQITDENYDGKLELHEKQLSLLCTDDPVAWKKDLDLAFIMSHHPCNWLSQRSQKAYNSEIAPPGRFFAHICGHLHKAKCLTYSEFGAEERRVWQSPSIFGLRTYGKDKVERDHGYSSCRIEFSDNQNTVAIWPRKMIEKYSGNRKLGPDSGYELNENNAVVIEFSSERKKTVSEYTVTDSCIVCNGINDIDASGINLDTNIQLKYDASNISRLPVMKLQYEPQHIAIRKDERIAFCNEIKNYRIVWLISDWGQGKKGFISSALIESYKPQRPTVFQLQCEELNNVDELFNAFDDQFGMTLQEFANVTSEIDLPILLFDKVPKKIINDDDQLIIFNEVIKALNEYNDKLCLIIDSRSELKIANIITVKLSALDLVETRAYLLAHPDVNDNILTSENIEHLFMWSDGLPMYLDYLVRSLRVTQFKDLVSIEIETKYDELQQAEPVPKALLYAVASLSQSESRYSRRSFRLLKILSVLSDGESLENIKRFDNAEPFYYQNAIELETLGLIDIILLIGPEPEIGQRRTNIDTDFPRLLRVPKQVRDYIKSILSENEYSGIINRTADILFGDKWKEGTVSLASSSMKQMIGPRPSGLGNEHTVIRQLLWEAVQKDDAASVKKVIRLAAAYLNKLNEIGRFKDAHFAAEELIHFISADQYSQSKAELKLIYGESSRMIGRKDDAIEILRSVIDDNSVVLTKSQKACAYLEMSLAYDGLGSKKEAIEAASTVTKLEKAGSSVYDQARAIIIKQGDQSQNIIRDLIKLKDKSRKLKRTISTNNIAIDLATLVTKTDDKIKYYDTVIDNLGDEYNKVRAVVNKTDVLLKANRQSELRHKDKIMLERAFSYAYSQKLQSLFNKCTRVIWELLLIAGKYDQMLKLFRYSSFLWRIRGEHDLEKSYLEKLADVSRQSIDSAQTIDAKYYKMRLGSFVGTVPEIGQ